MSPPPPPLRVSPSVELVDGTRLPSPPEMWTSARGGAHLGLAVAVPTRISNVDGRVSAVAVRASAGSSRDVGVPRSTPQSSRAHYGSLGAMTDGQGNLVQEDDVAFAKSTRGACQVEIRPGIRSARPGETPAMLAIAAGSVRRNQIARQRTPAVERAYAAPWRQFDRKAPCVLLPSAACGTRRDPTAAPSAEVPTLTLLQQAASAPPKQHWSRRPGPGPLTLRWGSFPASSEGPAGRAKRVREPGAQGPPTLSPIGCERNRTSATGDRVGARATRTPTPRRYLNETVPDPFTDTTPATGVAVGPSLHLPLLSLGKMPASVTVTLNVPLMPE